MQYSEIVEEFEDFFKEVYEDELGDIEAMGKRAAVVDFGELERFDPDLADEVLENPEECIEAGEEALSHLAVVDSELNLRFLDLPEERAIKIRNLRSEHLGNLIEVEGIVKRASEVRPEVVSADFECRSCGDIYTREQDSANLKSPYKCDCGNRKFSVVDKDMVDVQVVTVEENPQNLEGSEQPRKISAYLRDDMVDPEFQKRVIPGNEVKLTGVLKEAPQKKDSKRYELYMEGNYIDPVQTEFEEIEISPEEENEILELSNEEDIFQKILNSIAPSIYGHERLKEAVTLQMFSGVRKERPDGVITRGDLHVLLIGEPGTGKSQILKFVGKLAPKGKYVVGKSATGAGITATVVRDEMTEGFALEAGALVLANRGIATVDEIDKMSNEDRSSLHEAMEQQTISISKANIQATLQCRTSILAAGNPKFGRFDPYQPIAEQINIDETLLSRFDLIFPVRDVPDKEKDKKLADHILEMHTDPQEHRGVIDQDLFRKYIAYAKRNVSPELTEEAEKRIKDFYIDIRDKGSSSQEGEGNVPISARQLEALIRLSEASAKTRLSDTVEERDAKRAINLLTHCLKQVGVDPETGEFDIDRIETGVPSSQRERIRAVSRIIEDLKSGRDDAVPMEDVYAEAEEQGIEEDQVEDAIKKLEREGDIYRPRTGRVDKL